MSAQTARVAIKVPRKRSPFPSVLVDSVTLTVGTKSVNDINVTGQLKGPNAANLAIRTGLLCYLSDVSTGASVLSPYKTPNGGYAIGTNGVIRHGAQHQDVLYTKGTLLIDAVPEKFKTTTTAVFRAAGAQYTKAAATAIVFSSAHVVNATKFGVVLIQVSAAGAVSTKVALTPQVYTTAAAALAALPAPDAGKVALGYIAIAAGAGNWTANTDDMTNGSDLTTATFNDGPENGQYSPSFVVLPTAAGAFDITFTESRSPSTLYLVVVLPDGSLQVSGAITF